MVRCAYGLDSEISSDVELCDITLFCNSVYRYGSDKDESDLEALLLADTMREFVSYAVGCMFGRYSLDKPGLILANQDDTFEDYLWHVSKETEPLDVQRAVTDPKSVVLTDDVSVPCFACGTYVSTSEARFAIAERNEDGEHLRGRPQIYCAACAERDQTGYVNWQQPLARFNATQVLKRQWCEPRALKTFLELARCFAHRVSAMPDELQFLPDDDNVIPLLDGDWFTDDISERFKEFLKVTFGMEHYEENLTFLEDALYPNNATARKRKTIRDYFLREFYSHHVKMHKKRPIYWLFSSPRVTFNALIYMHRYRPDTVSTVLQYLRDFRDKLTHHAEHQQMIADSGSSTARERTRAVKEVATIKRQLKELEDYERETLFPLATKQTPIDLDDGVRHNYHLLGGSLKKVAGLSR